MADGTVLISGGSASTDEQSAYLSTEIYDPSADAFTPGPDMPSVRYKHIGTSLRLPWGGILLAAGAQQAALYDPALRSFTPVPGSMGSAALSRLFATATHLGDGTALIAGGYGIGQPVTSETWVYGP
ncbi:MAG: hypothetical protein FJZ97_09155 [Chloroflexi bacterium]|nr:hypothetical protein [Chloroflexota bacterium]